MPARRARRLATHRDYTGLMRDVERVLSERRDFEQMTPQRLQEAAQIVPDDVTEGVLFWERANAGNDAERLLRATPYEGPWS